VRTRTIVIGALLGCTFLFLVAVVACGGFFFYLYTNADKELSPKIDELFAAMDNGTFGDTYNSETTPELRQEISKEKFEQLGRLVKNRLGKLQSKILVSWYSRQLNMETATNVVYAATFEKGQGTIQAGFKLVGGQWRLFNLHVNSPELLKDMASANCPHCGKPCSPDAKFCPNCGKAIAAEKADDAEEKVEEPEIKSKQSE
jgi:hypothetical protein